MKPISQLKPMRDVTFMALALRVLLQVSTKREYERVAYEVGRSKTRYRQLENMAMSIYVVRVMAASAAYAKAHPLPPEPMPEHVRTNLRASLRAERERRAKKFA